MSMRPGNPPNLARPRRPGARAGAAAPQSDKLGALERALVLVFCILLHGPQVVSKKCNSLHSTPRAYYAIIDEHDILD